MIIRNILLCAFVGYSGFISIAQANETKIVPNENKSVQAQPTPDNEAKVLNASIPSDEPDYNKIIKEQLEAIRERNDRTAYELNTAALRDDYEDPQSFMRMLRRDKSSLYNHVAYEILTPASSDSKFHKVRLTDKYGKFAIAMFRIEEDTDGQWRTDDIVILSGSDDPI